MDYIIRKPSVFSLRRNPDTPKIPEIAIDFYTSKFVQLIFQQKFLLDFFEQCPNRQLRAWGLCNRIALGSVPCIWILIASKCQNVLIIPTSRFLKSYFFNTTCFIPPAMVSSFFLWRISIQKRNHWFFSLRLLAAVWFWNSKFRFFHCLLNRNCQKLHFRVSHYSK